MNVFPEPGRLVAHVFLDAASSYDGEAEGSELNASAVNLAIQRVGEIDGAYVVTVDDETDEITLDLSNVLGGGIITVLQLVRLLAEERGVDEAEVINDLRGFVDAQIDD